MNVCNSGDSDMNQDDIYVDDEEVLLFIENNYDILYTENKNNIKNDEQKFNPPRPSTSTLTQQFEENFDIYDYFSIYNQLFFEDKLGGVRLEWSKKMTLCAGVFSVKNDEAVIRLSEPLLKFRTVNEIKETLLHEMIHAWVYIEDLDMSDDRSGHGSNFKLKMYEINKNTGLNITVYHSFHDEVDYYRKHVWRCDGPCKNKAPYYGYVKRAVNRPPGKYDNWWGDHEKSCGGVFNKIEDPKSNNKDYNLTTNSNLVLNNMRDGVNKSNNLPKKKKKQASNKSNNNSTLDKFVKITNSTNNSINK